MAIWLSASPVVAHEGLPFPILVDQLVDGYCVSIWADPDLGIGTVIVVFEPTGSPPSATPLVDVWVQPADKSRPRANYPAQRQPTGRMQFLAAPRFESLDRWTIGAVIRAGGPPRELRADVDVTPARAGWGSTAGYLVPFAVLALLWVLALARGGSRRRRSAAGLESMAS